MGANSNDRIRRPRRIAVLLLVLLSLAATACATGEPVLVGDIAGESGQAAPQGQAAPTANANAAQPEVEDDGSADDNALESVAIVTAVPQATATPEPAVTQSGRIVATGGAVDKRLGTTLTMGETVAGVGSVEAYLTGEPGSDADDTWVLTNVDVESSLGTRWRMVAETFQLQNRETQEVIVASNLFSDLSERELSININDRDRTDLKVQFPMTELPETLDGWEVVINFGDTVPAVLPVSGPAYYEVYPINLLEGQTSEVVVPDVAGCRDGAVFDGLIERASINIEGRTPDGTSHYLPTTERFLHIDLAVTGRAPTTTVDNTSNCGLVGLWPDFVLMVDGRPTQPFRQTRNDVVGYSTETIGLFYKIGSDATRIELTGGADARVLAAWDVELPLATGERGADRIPSADTAVPIAPKLTLAERPNALVSNELSSGGAVGTMLFVDYTIGASTATSSGREGFVNGTPALSTEGRTYLVTELGIENTSTGNWSLSREDLVLEDPMGRPFRATDMYDRNGDKDSSYFFDGNEFIERDVVFETDGMVTDLDGWHLVVHNGGTIPLRVPLVGEMPEPEYPIALSTGEPTQVGTEPFATCKTGGLVDLEILNAEVGLEGPSGNSWFRVNPGFRRVVLDVSIVDRGEEGFNNCGLVSAWPSFLLDADGRLGSSSVDTLISLDYGERADFQLSYLVPADTQSIALLGGSGRTRIAEWDLRTPGQVLQDLGAVPVEGETLITLDETLLFAFGESTIQQSALPALTRVAKVLISESSGEVRIVGHTDAIGDDASNQALSEARAEAVAAALIAAGVDESRLDVSGQGESSPVAPNENPDGTDNPGGREVNRRVEVFFTSN